jgi:hypothetical protein
MTKGIKVLPRGEQRVILQEYVRALRQESHVFIQRPDLLWQQLYNRLQWSGELLAQSLATELARRSVPEAVPWMRTMTPVGESKALIRWDVSSRAERCTLELPISASFVAVHPCRPLVLFGGAIYWAELLGIEYRPIIVTAIDTGSGLTVRCPACRRDLPVNDSQLGRELTCPQPGCDSQLRLNSFVIGKAGWH